MAKKSFNPVPDWIENQDPIIEDGRIFSLGDLLVREDPDEADIAAATLLRHWDSPESFIDAVRAEKADREKAQAARKAELQDLALEDFEAFLMLGKEVADNAVEVRLELEYRDAKGAKHIICADLDRMLERVRAERKKRKEDRTK